MPNGDIPPGTGLYVILGNTFSSSIHNSKIELCAVTLPFETVTIEDRKTTLGDNHGSVQS